MVSRALFSDLGGFVAVAQGNAPQAAHSTTDTDTSAAIDRAAVSGDGALYSSACFVANHGAATGSPTSASVSYQIQDCATSGGSYENYGSAIVVSGASTVGKSSIDLRAAKRFIRVVATVTLAGGSTPTLFASSSFVFIDEKKR
mgnify:CR=1 FL=1